MSASTFQLHLVTDPRRGPRELIRAVSVALAAGVDWIQLRDKAGSAAALYDQASELLLAARRSAARVAVNDRLDVALAVGADGVHLAGQSLPVAAAVHVAERRLLVGRSVHSLPEARAAAAAGVDYLTFGHVYPTNSHPDLPPHGLAELAAIVQAVEVPVLAIGGITAANLEDVLGTGCAGIAVISAILAEADPGRAAARLRSALDASDHLPRFPFPSRERRPSHAADRQPTIV